MEDINFDNSLSTLDQTSNPLNAIRGSPDFEIGVSKQIQKELRGVSEVIPLFSSSHSQDAVTWTLSKNKCKTIIDLLIRGNTGESNYLSTIIQTMQNNINGTTDDYVSFSRGDLDIFKRGMNWLRNKDGQKNIDLELTKIAVKNVNSNLTSDSSANDFELNTWMLDNMAELIKFFGWDANDLGIDEEFIENNPGVAVNQSVKAVEDSISSAVAEYGPVLGIEGPVRPDVTIARDDSIIDEENKMDGMLLTEEDFAELDPIVDKLTNVSNYYVPIKEMSALYTELTRVDPEMGEGFWELKNVQVPTGGDTPTTVTMKALIWTPVSNSDLLAEIGSKTLADLESEAVEIPDAKSTAVPMNLNLIAHRSILDPNSNQNYKLVRSQRILTAAQALSLSNVLSKVTGTFNKLIGNGRLDDIARIVSTGLGIAGQLTGSAALTNASTIVNVVREGVSAVHPIATKLGTALPNVPVQQLNDTALTGTIFNVIPQAYKIGRAKILSNNADNTAVKDRVLMASRNTTEVRNIIAETVNGATPAKLHTRILKQVKTKQRRV